MFFPSSIVFSLASLLTRLGSRAEMDRPCHNTGYGVFNKPLLVSRNYTTKSLFVFGRKSVQDNEKLCTSGLWVRWSSALSRKFVVTGSAYLQLPEVLLRLLGLMTPLLHFSTFADKVGSKQLSLPMQKTNTYLFPPAGGKPTCMLRIIPLSWTQSIKPIVEIVWPTSNLSTLIRHLTI